MHRFVQLGGIIKFNFNTIARQQPKALILNSRDRFGLNNGSVAAYHLSRLNLSGLTANLRE